MKPFRVTILTLLFTPMLLLAQESSMSEAQANLLITGASYAKAWPISQVDCLNVTNTGVNGAVSSEVRDRFQEDLSATKPKAVIIWGYINDFSNHPREVAKQTGETAFQNVKAMAETAQQAGITPVLATEITMGLPDSIMDTLVRWINNIRGKQSFQDYISSNVMAVNERVRAYAKEMGFPILDIEKVMTNEEGNRKVGYYTEDYSHITKTAYQALDAHALPILQESLIKSFKLCGE
ncbi:MAG: GDSL-type esterase/lipase family protein [Candidatus Thiodiazotropha endolucinida]|nr:GDSL-type esterase/lipase family protein [Candidatus Thiodiazotropha taylori]MCW4312976.1 GDSL-type esterase/lipase family protein [Candidatus Thiodiazotropha taylori]